MLGANIPEGVITMMCVIISNPNYQLLVNILNFSCSEYYYEKNDIQGVQKITSNSRIWVDLFKIVSQICFFRPSC